MRSGVIGPATLHRHPIERVAVPVVHDDHGCRAETDRGDGIGLTIGGDRAT
jgi:hypothetical protein